jgi:TonB family protein
MFETVIPELSARKSRLLKAQTLPVSVAAHLTAMALAVLAAHWAVGFPEGQLVVRYIIGRDGRVKDVIVIDHAEDSAFDQAAVRAIRNWRFRPMIKDGQPTEVVHELTVLFRLEQEG